MQWSQLSDHTDMRSHRFLIPWTRVGYCIRSPHVTLNRDRDCEARPQFSFRRFNFGIYRVLSSRLHATAGILIVWKRPNCPNIIIVTNFLNRAK